MGQLRPAAFIVNLIKTRQACIVHLLGYRAMASNHRNDHPDGRGRQSLSSIFPLLAARISGSLTQLLDILSRSRLKVAIISYYFQEPTLSGVGIPARNLAKYLARHDCEVHAYCSGQEDSVYRENGVLVHTVGGISIPMRDSLSRKRLDYYLFESEVIKSIVRENSRRPFDIIHTQGALTKAAFIIKKACGTKWFHTFHAIEKMRVRKLDAESRRFADLVSWIEATVRYCDGAIFVSEELLAEGRRHYGRIKSKRVIPNGIDPELFRYSPLGGKNVLFIGRFSKEKGVDHLPDIISGVMEVKDASITIVSPHRPLSEDLKKIRLKLHEQQRRFGGRIRLIEQPQDQEVLSRLYKECRVYIQPSHYESFGLCVLEAMATGRPVVAFGVGGIPAVVGDAGFCVNDVREMNLKIKELLDDREGSEALGRRACQRARRFDWDTIAKQTLELYTEVRT